MADYWKSQPKKFCQYCKCWIADNKPSVEFHERGKNHKENVAAKIEEIKKKSIDKAKQEDRMSKEFAAMEEAALKAFQEDLKRLGAESGGAETPCPKPAVVSSNSRPDTWLEGVSDDGHTYYYNTLTGESRWEKPEGFQEKIKKWRPKRAENAKPSSHRRWMEALSPDGYTYYYNMGTGESSWEKPEGYTSSEKRGNSVGTAGRRDPPSLQHDPRTGEEETSDRAAAALEPEGSREPRVPKISFRRRKDENSQPSDGGVGEDKDDGEGESEGEDENELPTPRDQEVEEKEKEKEKEKVKTPAKRPRRTNPYGEWEQIQEEEDPYESVDLQLPQVEATPAPSEPPPEPRVRFRERTITSLGDETSEGGAFFRKRKAEGSKPRNLRQRGKDD